MNMQDDAKIFQHSNNKNRFHGGFMCLFLAAAGRGGHEERAEAASDIQGRDGEGRPCTEGGVP